VSVFAVDAATGAVAWSFDAPWSAGCSVFQRVGFAANADGTFVIAWRTDAGAMHASMYGADLVSVGEYDLGSSDTASIGPAVASSDAGFVVVGPDGLGLVLDPLGREVARFHHPTIALHTSLLRDLALQYDGTRVVFGPVWTGVVSAGQHAFTYDVIELSAADLGG
jgi:hypothetical protein